MAGSSTRCSTTPCWHLDLVAAAWIHGHVTLQGLRDFDVVTQLGTIGVGVTVTATSIWLWRRREWLLVSGWLGTNAGGWMVDWALKTSVHRARPRYSAQFLHRASYSFPSGHTMGAMICYPALAMVLASVLGLRGWQRGALYATAIGLVVAVGVSRVYLGVHYPSDVAGGMAAGAAWLSACWLLFSGMRHRAQPDAAPSGARIRAAGPRRPD